MQSWNQNEYLISLAEAIANGISLEDFKNFCEVNDLQMNIASLKFFENQQSQKESVPCAHSQSDCFFLVKFKDIYNETCYIKEKNELEAIKLYNIFKRQKGYCELYKIEN